MLRRSFLALVASLSVLTACGGDDSTGPGEINVAGSYTLQTVAGNTLPWRLIVVGDDWIELRSGSGALNADGTFSLTFNFQENFEGEVTDFSESVSGIYVRNGSAITFTFPDGSRANGTITANGITITDANRLVYVYRRT